MYLWYEALQVFMGLWHKDIINHVGKVLRSDTDTHVHFSDPQYQAVPFSADKYHTLVKKDAGTVVYIDGGNAELIHTPHLSVSMIRVAGVVFENHTKISTTVKEFFLVSKAQHKEGELFFSTELFGDGSSLVSQQDVLVNSVDDSLMVGSHRASISAVALVARRFAELSLAAEFCNKLQKGSCIVLDGTLQATYPHEQKYLEQLYTAGLQHDVVITGVSKTSTLMTNEGNVASNVVRSRSNMKRWAYHPVAVISNPLHQADLAFAQFHEQSKHVFRVEIYQKQREVLPEVLYRLVSHCTDPVFFGYPYGLIVVDREARISNQEQEMRLVQLKTLFGKNWQTIEAMMASENAHSVLDSIG